MNDENRTPIAPEALAYPLPKAVYQLKVVEATSGVSGAGNPQIVLDLELVNNAKVLAKDESGQPVEMDPNGLKVRTWVTLTEKAIMFANRANKGLGMPEITAAELDSVQSTQYIGKTGFAICSGSKKPKKDSNGNVMINPHTQQPMTVNERNLDEWCLP